VNQITALPVSGPEEQGISSSAILGFVEAIEKNPGNIHSFMLLRHGTVASQGWWDPYEPHRRHILYSLSKSFTSTAVGFAVTEGLLTIDDLVVDHFPDDLPAVLSDNLASMRLRDLLTMTTGHAEDTLVHVREQADGNWARAFLSLPVEYEPGAHFLYNSGATYMLSAIIQRLTGQTLVDYLTPRLFDPLGIQDPTWETCPRGINTGGWGLSTTTEDIARFGQFCLQRGEWQGRQLLPAQWLDAATSFQVPNAGSGMGDNVDDSVDDSVNDWAQGYGYQFWRCRHNVYRGDGAFGQFCIVMPDQDAVLAITSGVEIMQSVLDQVWTHLLPAMADDPLPADRAAQQKLADRLAGLTLPYPEGSATSPVADQVSGRRYQIEPNGQGVEAVSFVFDGDRAELIIERSGAEHRIVAGCEAWQQGVTALEYETPTAIAAAGAWMDSETYCLRMHFIESPYYLAFTCRFSGDRVFLDSSINVSFGPTERPQLIGHFD
jgi:CubicO group peptidase (beta-lactamase class C family)